MEIRIFDVLDGITKLGPGVRFGLWTQGCPRSCPGCMSKESQPLDGGYMLDVDTLANRIIQSGRSGLTVSGGEPFLQAEALAALISKVRAHIDIGVILYTGYVYEDLLKKEDPAYSRLISLCDLIIDGPYVDSLNDGMSYRGSSNQRALLLTDRYLDFAQSFGTEPAQIEFFSDEEQISIVGIPSKEVLEKFKKTKF